MNYSNSSFPIKCRKCGNGFTRSPEGNNRYRFKCKSKAAKDKKCNCSCQACKGFTFKNVHSLYI